MDMWPFPFAVGDPSLGLGEPYNEAEVSTVVLAVLLHSVSEEILEDLCIVFQSVEESFTCLF